MTEEQSDKQRPSTEQSAREAWRDVGARLEALGDSLSQAARTTWEREETQEQLRTLQDGLTRAADEVDRVVREATVSDQATRLRGEAEKAAESLRDAGEQTWDEARPRLVAALRRLSSELQDLIDRLESRHASGAADRPADAQAAPVPSEEDDQARAG